MIKLTDNRKRSIIAIPDDMCIVMDNLIDNKLICNRTDAFKHIIYELSKRAPELVKFDKMVYIKDEEFTELKNKLAHIITSQSKQNIVIERVNKWYEDDVLALEGQSFELALDNIESKLNAWARVGNDGLNYLRMNGYFKKKETESAPVQP